MAEGYTNSQRDLRTFATQQARLLDDLNRPDLSNIVTEYLQDAMRFWARRPFFFNETDNTTVPSWGANTYYPQGSTIQATVSGTAYAFVAVQAGVGQSGGVSPTFPSATFTVPTGQPPVIPPPTLPSTGAVQDNTVIWVNVGALTPTIYTNLSTVYNINQYVPPIDYVAPERVEITWSGNLRIGMVKISYDELRNYDVVRPSPPYSYPTFWAWFQQQIYLWPYPNSFYPITLSYRTAPQIPTNASDTNFWTTQAERLIRKYAQAIIEREVMHDPEASQISMQSAMEELSVLRSEHNQQNATGGITPSRW